VRLQKLARGAGSRSLRPVEAELVFEQAEELEYPVTELEPLSFVLNNLLHQLCDSLESRALAAIEICLTLKLENQTEHARAIRLPVPMRDVKILLKLLQLEFERPSTSRPDPGGDSPGGSSQAPRRAGRPFTLRRPRSRKSWS